MVTASPRLNNGCLGGNDSMAEPQWHPIPAEFRSALCRTVYPPLICLGVLCNLAALATFQQARLRRNPVSLGLSTLAVLDTLVLLLGAGRFWAQFQLGFDWQVGGPAACRVSLFCQYWAADSSVWTLLVVTGQRFAGARLPLRAAQLCTRRRTVPLLLAAAALCAVKNSPLLALAAVRRNPFSGPLCQIVHHPRVWLAFAWVDATFRFLIPWPSLAVMNACIWRGVRAAGRFRRRAGLNAQPTFAESGASQGAHTHSFTAASSLRLQNQQQQQQQPAVARHPDDSRRMLSMLVAVNLMFLICQTPFCVFSLVDSLMGLFGRAVRANDAALYVTLATCFQVALTCVYASHAANFFLYCLSGRLFRRTLQRMLRRAWRRCRRR